MKWTGPAALAVVMGLAAGGVGLPRRSDAKAGHAQQGLPRRSDAKAGRATSTTTLPTLTPMDYIEIRQLVARYAYAVDTGAENGNVYASLFAPDGVFLDRNGRPTSGKEALAALARRNTRGQQSAFHFIMNHVIEPSAGGATGKEYLVQLRMGEGERRNEILGGGHYEDVYVRTPDGWRFKQRQFLPSERPPPRQPAPAR